LKNGSIIELGGIKLTCVFCGGETEYKEVTFIYEGEDNYIVVKNVPAEVCERCGERMYTPEITEELLKFAQYRFKPTKTIQIPVFDYTEKIGAA
jgi:YgiT-type zinc finger domain-containing protein